MKLLGLDHLVLTVASIDATVAFYSDILGFEEVTFAGDRKAVSSGHQKINLHRAGAEIEPHALRPTRGSGDICLIYDGEIDAIADRLRASGVEIEEGPVDRTGAIGSIRSVYVRDPDQNLIELSVYLSQ